MLALVSEPVKFFEGGSAALEPVQPEHDHTERGRSQAATIRQPTLISRLVFKTHANHARKGCSGSSPSQTQTELVQARLPIFDHFQNIETQISFISLKTAEKKTQYIDEHVQCTSNCIDYTGTLVVNVYP